MGEGGGKDWDRMGREGETGEIREQGWDGGDTGKRIRMEMKHA